MTLGEINLKIGNCIECGLWGQGHNEGQCALNGYNR